MRWSRCPSGGRSGVLLAGRHRGYLPWCGPAARVPVASSPGSPSRRLVPTGLVPVASSPGLVPRVPSPGSSCAPGLPVPQVFPSPRSSRPPGLSCAPNLRMRPIYQAHPQISGAGMCGRGNARARMTRATPTGSSGAGTVRATHASAPAAQAAPCRRLTHGPPAGSSSRIGNFLRPKSEHAPDISGASSDFGRGSGARRGEAMAIGLWRRQAHVSVSAAPAASVLSGGDTACSCRSLAGPTQPPCSSRCSRTREPAHCAVRR